VTKCNENQSKEETKNKAHKIINTGKYMINQPVNITYQEAQRRVIIIDFLLHTHFIKFSFTFKIVPFNQLLTVDMLMHILSLFLDPKCQGSTKDNYKVCYYTQ
jgi:hypothetical protein